MACLGTSEEGLQVHESWLCSLSHSATPLGCRHQAGNLTVLDVLMRKVPAYVDVFGALPSSDDVVSPLDASGVVFVYRSVWILRKTHVLEEDPCFRGGCEGISPRSPSLMLHSTPPLLSTKSPWYSSMNCCLSFSQVEA